MILPKDLFLQDKLVMALLDELKPILGCLQDLDMKKGDMLGKNFEKSCTFYLNFGSFFTINFVKS